jgi:hypothetical protein
MKARDTYELRIGSPRSDDPKSSALPERVIGLGLTALAIASGEVTLDGGQGQQAVRVVERATDRVVMSIVVSAVEARGLADLISRDLDELESPAFALEWGITR